MAPAMSRSCLWYLRSWDEGPLDVVHLSWFPGVNRSMHEPVGLQHFVLHMLP